MRILSLVLILMLAACSATDDDKRTGESAGSGTGQSSGRPASGLPRRTVAIGDVHIEVELAANSVTRGVGLSDRDAVAPGTGMLFIYPRAGLRSFWMKGCRIGLDIAYLDDDRHVISIGSLDPPPPGTTDEDMPRFRSTVPARFVLETAKGWMATRGITVGRTALFSDDIEEIVAAVEAP